MPFAVNEDNSWMSEHVNRRRNLLALFTQFVTDSQLEDPSAPLAGMDKAFAAKIQIAGSSLSSYKSGARPIGPRIARQIESLLALDSFWMDQSHEEVQPSEDCVELSRFLKLAERAYKRSSPAQRDMLRDVLKLSLQNTHR